ncbi:hypothetical protein CO051_04600 [Candidatus Roizmanbacteria bacterium CG_4_9_14_0_2_um_filter_39_13]|uniref:Uncharacterized protein n=2 Tax=Candidatus Roizmaniibacteriota TaxID=1752723 RepID=A0A2M8EXV6_9BACT|nr:MAG: hypothetical protein COY15_04155 [Candidatus Roizmanbacteria bacterium CG_4_10_14_0_2_um_filter_39_12]PJC31023.1 MAG: hypothetical protein CO051_04600 [Candidatus Roizmanbacteria bacterium CG_4_9_14_0_2_um_filter_39_13]PJE61775.1 MAG: hypothetical protein COU87_02805 [Candidatus Roizmanbacteria bacterium CG10_big_fil_rev_8_21_14_0_10_39_12]
MEEFIKLLTTSSSDDFVGLFIKAFAVLFAFLYLLYAVAASRQTQIMNDTFTTKMSPILSLVSFLQIIFAGILILVSLFLI